MKKWISGIVISVVAGLLVWFFTQSSYSPFAGPQVELSDLTYPDRIVAGEAFQVSFKAENQRNRSERDCHGFVSIWPPRNDDGGETGGGSTASSDNQAVAVAETRRAAAECATRNDNFYLGSLSGSSVEIVVDCVVRRAGDFRMISGLSCRSGENSKWQLDHHSLIEVVQP